MPHRPDWILNLSDLKYVTLMLSLDLLSWQGSNRDLASIGMVAKGILAQGCMLSVHVNKGGFYAFSLVWPNLIPAKAVVNYFSTKQIFVIIILTGILSSLHS